MDREESPAIARLKDLQKYPLLGSEKDNIERIIEAILDLDARHRTHSHEVKETRDL